MATFHSDQLFTSTTPDLTGGITFRVEKPFSLVSLQNSRAGKRFMHYQDWYDKHDFTSQFVQPGAYELRLPIPNSESKSFMEQRRLLSREETPIPIALAVGVLLCIQQANGPDPLNGAWIRCAETPDRNYHVTLAWLEGKLALEQEWFRSRGNKLFLAASRIS